MINKLIYRIYRRPASNRGYLQDPIYGIGKIEYIGGLGSLGK